MEKTKLPRTAGNWFYQEDSDAYTHIVRPESNPGRIIAHLSQDTSGETEANARLIAAAPLLYEALVEAITELEKFIPITEVAVLDKCNQALSLAK